MKKLSFILVLAFICGMFLAVDAFAGVGKPPKSSSPSFTRQSHRSNSQNNSQLSSNSSGNSQQQQQPIIL